MSSTCLGCCLPACLQVCSAWRKGRVDAVVQSTDKNFMVPVGGAVIAARRGATQLVSPGGSAPAACLATVLWCVDVTCLLRQDATRGCWGAGWMASGFCYTCDKTVHKLLPDVLALKRSNL
jgi:hypothetical protein